MAPYPKTKRIADLGVAAWIKMHDFRISCVEKNCVYFVVESETMGREIEELQQAYVNSDAVTFDSWIMSLKQMPITTVNEIDPEVVVVEGLGPAAFMRHKGRWRMVGRPHHVKFAFFVPVDELTEFNNLRVSWTNSDLRDFDAAMMSIKSIRSTNERRG